MEDKVLKNMIRLLIGLEHYLIQERIIKPNKRGRKKIKNRASPIMLKALAKIKTIIENPEFDDSRCIEEIIKIYEALCVKYKNGRELS